MTMLLKASEVIGRLVVSIADGDDVAEVRDVVYDGDRHRLLGFTLNKRGFFHGRMKQLLPAEDIVSIGPDAVMISDRGALAEAGEVRDELSDAPASRDVIGARVVTDGGRDLGKIVDVIMRSGARPEAIGYQIEHKDRSGSYAYVPITSQMAVSGDALIVPEAAADDIRDDLAGLGAIADASGPTATGSTTTGDR